VNGKDYYKILGVPRTATQEEIKKAHRKLARKHHPDLNPGDKKAEETFKSIQEAYDILSDPEKRTKYDQLGDLFASGPFNPGAGGFSARPGTNAGGFSGSPFAEADLGGNASGLNVEELLERMFGLGKQKGSRPSNPTQDFGMRSAAPAEDVEFGLDISLEDAYQGTSQRINVTVEDVCPECEGLGQRRNNRGQLDLNAGVCPRCKGRGRISSPRTGQVSIPPGAWDGLRLKLTGQGAADAQGKRGDLYVQLHITPHPKFERDGQDLLFDVAVPFTIAALGGEVKVEMLDGQTRQLLVPPGIQTGQKLRLTGQGMPALRDRKTGDAYARVKITVPRNLSERERSLIEELARLRNDPVRSGAAQV
jgi:DnaJ-class molecular chaperone